MKSGRGHYANGSHHRSSSGRQSAHHAKSRHQGEKYWLVRSIGKVASNRKDSLWNKFKKTKFAKWPNSRLRNRVYVLLILALFIFSTAAAIIQPFLNDKLYGVTESVRAVLPEPKAHLGAYLKYNDKESKFLYNDGYTGPGNDASSKLGQGEPRITADIGKEASKGVSIEDTQSQVSFKLTPKFKVNAGKQDQNQVFYPLTGKSVGYLVYTAQTASIKEDIVLEKFVEDRMSFEYDLDLANGLEARLEKNGSIGVYGASLPINGNVSTASEKDAELLQKARQSAEKNKLMFVIPKPVVVESGKEGSVVNSWFELKDGNKLTLIAEGLSQAQYPLSIDPSVYVESAVQLMRGNNETNVEFDVATEQFKKGATTGARIDRWTNSTDMSSSAWNQSMAAANGYVYRAGGSVNGRTMPRIVSTTSSNLGTPPSGTTTPVTSNSFTVNMPATRPTGDLYIAIIANDVNGTNTITAPGGWTLIQNVSTREYSAYYRYNAAGGTEGASYVWTKAGNAVQWSGTVLRIKGFAVSGGLPQLISAQSSATSGIPSYPSVTPTNVGALILRSAAVNDAIPPGNQYSPAGYSDVTGVYSGGTSGVGLVASALDSPPASGSPIGTASIPASANISGAYGASTIAIYGNAGTTTAGSSLEWARFNTVDGSISSPAPGSDGVACSGWCTNSAYDLPAGAGTRSGSLIAYNGYLYAIGGVTTAGATTDTIYVAKLGVNGEPSLWHPTSSTQANWVYWYPTTTLPSARAYHSVYAYNGKMYLMGGDTTPTTYSSGALDTTHIADIIPNGTLGSWSSSVTLPSAMSGASAQAYNGYLYILGGHTNSAINSVNSTGVVYYSKIDANGSLGAWRHAAADGSQTGFATPRASGGGVMTGVWGGYIYLSGGCTAFTAQQYCSSIASDVQLASINADGTLDAWGTMLGLRNQRFGHSFIAWQNNLYRFGGCSLQDTSSGDCVASHITSDYGTINQDGDASTVSISTASGSGSCQGDDPYDCDLPSGGGQALASTVVLNGFLYVIGGCTSAACTTMSTDTSYTSIDSTGRLKTPPSCSGTLSGAWCTDAVTAGLGTGGIGAASPTVFNGTIYLVGGQNGSAAKNAIFRNTVNTDGSLTGSWQGQQLSGGTNLNAVSLSYTYAYSRANPTDATYPGNLYMFGGCTSPASGAGCTSGNNYSQAVYKCKISTTGALGTGATDGCTTSGQLPIGTIPNASNPGLGIHAGAVYANYIYLIGGVADGATTADLKTVRYAKFDNSNNVVAVSGGAWTQSNVEMNNGRRRGTAFGYNGYLYAVGGFEATIEQPLDSIEFVKINVSDGSLTSSTAKPGSPGTYLFKRSAVTINQRWGLGMIVSNSYAYVLGGCKVGQSPTCNTLDSTVQTFQLYNNNSGVPAKYNVSANLFGTDRLGASAAVLNGYLYMAAGSTGTTDGATPTDTVAYAPLNAYGEVGTWTTSSNAGIASGANPGRVWGKLLAAKNTLYWVGGQDYLGAASDRTYYTTSIVNGDPTFALSGSSGNLVMPASRKRLSAAVWNDRIYILAGYDGSNVARTEVYMSNTLTASSPVTWNASALTALNVGRAGATAIAYANNLYILGGYTGSRYLSDVQYAKINTDGTIGSWNYTTNLPVSVADADGFAVNGYMYLVGGRTSGADCTPRTLAAPISANTTIVSGNNPTGVGEWYETNRKYDTGRFGAAVAYADGKSYVLGGACEGVVMRDDFDGASAPYYNAAEWTSISNMAADYRCQSISASRTLSGTVGGSSGGMATTKLVSMPSGGTVNFKLYMPLADINTGGGTCYRGEAAALLSAADVIRIEYCTGACGGVWNALGSYTYNSNDPLRYYSVTAPAGATGFRWYVFSGSGANDSFALEDVSIIANGNTTLLYTGSKRVQYTSVLSQPQVASYSRLIDAGKDVFPTSWLMNGIDNSIGARWQYAYRSMNDPTAATTCGTGGAMTAYGQLTTFGDVTLGTPSKYTVRDGSGADIGCSRYFFSTISIDASRTYGYPDDISRGPTLDNFTLFFQSNPGQRLLHGKAFVEGQQQPLDTQCRQSNPLVSGNPSASGCLP